MKSNYKVDHAVKAVALTFALLTMSASHASVTPLVFTAPYYTASITNTPAQGSFDDFFTFTMPSFGDITSAAVTFNIGTFINIASGSKVDLFQGVYGDLTPDVKKLEYTFDGGTGGVPNNVTIFGVPAGSYYFEVSGNATGALGGIYNFGAHIAPTMVPEPETYGMLMAGLGLMGFIARRRMKV